MTLPFSYVAADPVGDFSAPGHVGMSEVVRIHKGRILCNTYLHGCACSCTMQYMVSFFFFCHRIVLFEATKSLLVPVGLVQ